MTTREAVIVAAKRTPVGRAKRGSLVYTRPEDMGKVVIDALLRETGVDGKDVNDLLVGCAMPEGEQGMNLARIVGYYSDLPQEVPAATVNRFCSSGLETISIAAARIMAGFQDVVIAGGIETMSMIPMGGNKIVGHPVIAREMVEIYTTMGNTAELVLERYGKDFDLTREALDRFSYESHMKAVTALAEGKFKEQCVPVPYVTWVDGKKVEGVLTEDEGPRGDTTLEALGGLKAAFKTKDGSVTAGNSSQMNDAASFVMLMTAEEAKRRKLPVLAFFRNYQVVGVDPAVMGIGPAFAIPKVLEKAGVELKDVDLFEINEAFASQALYSVRKLGIDPAKVNVNGGAIALGHPLGCTGAKLTTQLLYEMKARKSRYGIVSMCIGGGMGAAGLFERPAA
jgi:acetyl-CoA acyltransferase